MGMTGGIEVAGDWRRQQGLWAVVSGQVSVDEARRHGLPKAMSQAARTRTSEEVLTAWEQHLNDLQNEALSLAILAGMTRVEELV
jgi:hypothetical protein